MDQQFEVRDKRYQVVAARDLSLKAENLALKKHLIDTEEAWENYRNSVPLPDGASRAELMNREERERKQKEYEALVKKAEEKARNTKHEY